MQRDMELIREILLWVESHPELDGMHFAEVTEEAFPEHSAQELQYHLNLLFDEGFVNGMKGGETSLVSKLTWKGHEFLDDTRDPSVWEIVKQRMKGLSGVGLSMVGEIAKAEIRKRLGL
jgi:hypothetical protein